MNIKCVTAHCQFWSLAAARLLGLGVGHGGLNVDRLTAPWLVSVTASICDLLLGHYFCQNVVKCSLHIGGVQGGGLDEAQGVLLGEGLGLLGWHSPQVPQVRLVTNLG